MNRTVYFDHAATTPVKEEVLKEMIPYFSVCYGNASSLYKYGRNAKKALEASRAKVAKIIGAKSSEIYFTSGGSESDNLALKGIARKYKEKGKHIITSKIEHPAILNTCKALEKEEFEITYLNVNTDGLISLSELERNIRDDTILISIMYANNEIGTIEPIYEIGSLAHKYNVFLHTDAVQAVGNVNIDVSKTNTDLLSMSSHKFYGPKGVGALYIKEGINVEKIIYGGHQESDIRAGTENISGIVGMGIAAELAYRNINDHIFRLTDLRDYCVKEIESKFPSAKLNGHKSLRLPGNCNFSFRNIDSEEILFKLDEKGIYVSAGSACSSKSNMPSHVLLALGLGKNEANSSIRITFGDENTKEDVDYLIECLDEIINS